MTPNGPKMAILGLCLSRMPEFERFWAPSMPENGQKWPFLGSDLL
jgi:hypothetical protein